MEGVRNVVYGDLRVVVFENIGEYAVEDDIVVFLFRGAGDNDK